MFLAEGEYTDYMGKSEEQRYTRNLLRLSAFLPQKHLETNR